MRSVCHTDGGWCCAQAATLECPSTIASWPRGVALDGSSGAAAEAFDDFDDDGGGNTNNGNDTTMDDSMVMSVPRRSPDENSNVNDEAVSPASPRTLGRGSAAAEVQTPTTVEVKRSVRWVPETPTTAPARMHAHGGGDDLMTPMRAKTPSTKVKTLETDRRRLGQRAKQINYGKATLGYLLCKEQTRDAPPERLAELPRTPREAQKCSKRCWDAQVRDWRVRLHAFDPKSEGEWRAAFAQHPRECLELAAALSKNATQFSQTQCMPPADIMADAVAAEAAAEATRKRGPVARSLGALMDSESRDGLSRDDEDAVDEADE